MKLEQSFKVDIGESKGIFVLSGGKQVFTIHPEEKSHVVLEIKVTQTTND